MPHLIMKRSDIPAGKLQVLDLDPHTSNRSPAHDPPGQTKYINPVVNDIVALYTVGGVVRFQREASGLAAWFATRTQNGAVALTAAQAMADAAAVLGILNFGAAGAAGALDLATVNGAITGTLTAPLLTEMLEVLAGREYRVPRDTQVEAAGAFAVLPAVGAAGGPEMGTFRKTYVTSHLQLSFQGGSISKFRAADFEYLQVQGQALVVYNDDGTLYA